jgi:DHA1 family multidrug resistance protein-like MFS transporter
LDTEIKYLALFLKYHKTILSFITKKHQSDYTFKMNSWKQTLYIMFFAQIMTSVGFSSIFPFLPLYIAHLGSKSGLSVQFLAGLVFSVQAFTMMIASPFWGVVADRWGRKLMVNRSMFGGCVLVLLMGFAYSAEQLVLLRAIQGLVTGVIGAASALVAAEVPRERCGYAMGLLQMGMSIGVAIGPFLGGTVADLIGYRAVFFVTSFLLFIAGVFVLFGVKEKFIPPEKSTLFKINLYTAFDKVLKITEIRVAYTARFIIQLGRMMLLPILPFYIQTLLDDSGQFNTLAGLVIGTSSATMTVGAFYLGRIGDRIGHQRIFIFSALSASVLYCMQSLVVAGWQLLLLQAMIGVTLGGIVPSISALLAKKSQIGSEGSVFGIDHAVNAGARAAAPLVGAGIAIWLELRMTFVAAGIFFLIAGVMMMCRRSQHA